jgi:hypothetical protein
MKLVQVRLTLAPVTPMPAAKAFAASLLLEAPMKLYTATISMLFAA